MEYNYNKKIEKQLEDYIKNPAVLMSKDEVPYEFRDGGSINRLKRRRNGEIPYELYNFLIEHNIPLNKLREFASGYFLNYIDMNAIYN